MNGSRSLLLAVLLAMGSHLAVAAESAGADAGGEPLVPPVVLPNGAEFRSWAKPPIHTRTYHVDQQHPQAADDNPGTAERPFRTINRAAQLLQPGERVVVASGVYRERVAPARGGSDPSHLISYEAAPGTQVILSGSQVLAGNWTRSPHAAADGGKPVWMMTLPPYLFPEENPFAESNLTDAQIDRCMDWAVPIKGRPVLRLRRGLVFQDGQRLQQVLQAGGLAARAGSYWVEADGRVLHLRPQNDADPARTCFEVTVRGMIFAPRSYGLGYLRVQGFTIQHAGNCFPRPQQGALSAQRGHHWIIEDNTVRQCNAIGIDIGDQFDTAGPKLAEGGRHIVRRNRICDCGIGGLEGTAITHTLIEDNVIRRCGWHDIWPLYETGGVKVHLTQSCVLRRNLVADTTAAPGIWLDWGNVNSRVTGNVILNADCSNGGIFMEASQQPNLVDHNFVWGTRGNGIHQHDCDELTIAHNLVAHSRQAAIRMQVCQGRIVLGRPTTAKRNKILNNVLLQNGGTLAISDPENVSDYNVFADAEKPFDLAQWQERTGWDQHSVLAPIQAQFDPIARTFSWQPAAAWTQVPGVPLPGCDLLGQPRVGPRVWPGPFANSLTRPVTLLPSLPPEIGDY